jgi:hypothetical protein
MRRVLSVLACGLAGLVVPMSGAAAGASAIVRMPLDRSAVRGAVGSTNWSGYATYNATFTDVKGSWIQPTATCSTSGHRYAAFWVGLDGYNSNSVEQIGTDSDCLNKNRPSYYAWIEMYPAAPVNLSSSKYPVAPKDSISAEVKASGSSYTLVLTNTTRAWSYTTTQSSTTAQNSSAEWVAEAPSSCFITCTVLPLANFGTVNFTGSATTGNGQVGTISTFTNDTIVMTTNNGTVKAQPSALASNGASFSDTWRHA